MKRILPTIATWLAANWLPALKRRTAALERELADTQATLRASEKDAEECKARIRELLAQGKLYAESLRLANLKLGEVANHTPKYR